MITSEYILELSNVFHSGQVSEFVLGAYNVMSCRPKMQLLQVEAGTCLQKMIGTVRTGVILKDVSVEVHGGELSAILGSKGTDFYPGKLKGYDKSRRFEGTNRNSKLKFLYYNSVEPP